MYPNSGFSDSTVVVEQYAPLVKRIAYHLIARLPPNVLVDDLIQAGLLALLDAAGHYDPGHGASFETYATIRVRGAMLDELRRNDWTPKSVHRRARELDEAMLRVEQRTGQDATDLEVAEEMGVPLDEYFRILQDASSSKMLSFDDLGIDDGAIGHRDADETESVQLATVEREQFQQRLAEAIAKLPDRERLIITLYYDRELNLREIGAVLKVTESRVSQLMSQAQARLRSRLRDFID